MGLRIVRVDAVTIFGVLAVCTGGAAGAASGTSPSEAGGGSSGGFAALWWRKPRWTAAGTTGTFFTLLFAYRLIFPMVSFACTRPGFPYR